MCLNVSSLFFIFHFLRFFFFFHFSFFFIFPFVCVFFFLKKNLFSSIFHLFRFFLFDFFFFFSFFPLFSGVRKVPCPFCSNRDCAVWCASAGGSQQGRCSYQSQGGRNHRALHAEAGVSNDRTTRQPCVWGSLVSGGRSQKHGIAGC